MIKALIESYLINMPLKDLAKKIGVNLKNMQFDIVSRCASLPLSLEVIAKYPGKFNYKGISIDEQIGIWKEACKRLCSGKNLNRGKH